MKDKPTAFFPGKDYDQSSWIFEKTCYVLSSLCSAIDTAKDEETKKKIRDAISDCLKLYAFWAGDMSLYCDDVKEFLFEYGKLGFDRLKYVSGKTSIKDTLTLKIEDKEKYELIKSLISSEKIRRTELFDAIRSLHFKNQTIKLLDDDLEQVALGYKPWSWLVSKYRLIMFDNNP